MNYPLLRYLATTGIPLVLWMAFMALVVVAGGIFNDPAEFGTDLFMAFVFPTIAAPIIGGLALLIAKLLTLPVVRYLVLIGLGFAVPLGAYVLALAGHWVARALYAGDKAEVPVWLYGTATA
jgi:hypothetical protein